MSIDRPPDDFRGAFRRDLAGRAVYAEAAGIARVVPHAVAVPVDPDDVVALVRWARAEGMPLVPRGSGSSMPGGAIGTGVIVDLSRLDVIGVPDRDTKHVTVGPGAIRNRVDMLARTADLRFPVDPSSGAFCTIGGMVSTNAAGARTLRYGATRAWVNALDCVFADGARGVIRRGESPPGLPLVERFATHVAPDIRAASFERAGGALRKNSSGYGLAEYAASGDLVDILVGSEGTLAVVVGVELALVELPGATASLLAAYASIDEAVGGASHARDAGASACELLDRTFLDIAKRAGPLPLPSSTDAVLLIEIEGRDAADVSARAYALAEAVREGGATTVTLGLHPDDEERLWELRHAASPILSRLDPSLKSMQFIEDGVVPPMRLADYVRGVRAALESHEVTGVIFGHAGDAHVHVNPLIDVRRPDWRERVDGVLDDVIDLTARLGGSLAGEHGDGSLRAPMLHRTTAAHELDLARRVKQAFDPDFLLNPGVKVPHPGQQPIGDIKYDPALPPLPVAAARVLARVERDRAYSEFRLALLEQELRTE